MLALLAASQGDFLIPDDSSPQVIGKTEKKASTGNQVSFRLSDEEVKLKEQFAALAGSIKEPLLNFMRAFVQFGGEVQVLPSKSPVKEALDFYAHFVRLSAEQRDALKQLAGNPHTLKSVLELVERKAQFHARKENRERKPG